MSNEIPGPSGLKPTSKRSLDFTKNEEYMFTPEKRKKTKSTKDERFFLSDVSNETAKKILEQLLSSDESSEDENEDIPIFDISASALSPAEPTLPRTPVSTTKETPPARPFSPFLVYSSESSSERSLSPTIPPLSAFGMLSNSSVAPSTTNAPSTSSLPSTFYGPSTSSAAQPASSTPPIPVSSDTDADPPTTSTAQFANIAASATTSAAYAASSPPPITVGSHTGADPQVIWSSVPPTTRPSFSFTGNTNLKKLPAGSDPKDFFDLVFTSQFFDLLVVQTNLFSEELFCRQGGNPKARITDWKDTAVEEIRKFIGLNFHMGVIQLNRQKDYWSTHELFNLPFFRKHMSRDRWLLLQQAFHLAPNPQDEEEDPDDPLYKIRPMINYFHDTMSSIVDPGKNVSGDESMAPWRGRIYFRQYIPNKSHKYGIKLYMLTEPDGLIHRVIIYIGSADTELGGQGHAYKVVMKLMEGFLGEGRSIYLDNYYNSVELAASLLKQNTTVTGTLRRKRKGNPEEVLHEKLKKGQVVSRWSPDGIVVAKWKDKREVLGISTEFTGDLTEIQSRRGTSMKKPELIVQYNKYMGGVDRVDQLLSYYTKHTRTLRWYKKLAFHFLELMLLNAYLLYKKYSVSSRKLEIYDFRLAIVTYLCGDYLHPTITPPKSLKFMNATHFPEAYEIPESSSSKKTKYLRCRECSKKKIRKNTAIHCPACPDKPGLCLKECFLNYHAALGFRFQ